MAPDAPIEPDDFDRSDLEHLLKDSPLLAGMELRVRDAIAHRFQGVVFDSGDRIIKAGGHERKLGILLTGTATVLARKGGKELPVATLAPGDLFGEIAFFDAKASRSADVVGAAPGVAGLLDYRTYMELADGGNPAAEVLEKNVLDILGQRMHNTNDRLSELLESSREGGLRGALRRLFGMSRNG